MRVGYGAYCVKRDRQKPDNTRKGEARQSYGTGCFVVLRAEICTVHYLQCIVREVVLYYAFVFYRLPLVGKTRAARVNSQWKSTATRQRRVAVDGFISIAARPLPFEHGQPSLTDASSQTFNRK
jgi:hypothetical protein